jgi:hypothetical protein
MHARYGLVRYRDQIQTISFQLETVFPTASHRRAREMNVDVMERAAPETDQRLLLRVASIYPKKPFFRVI